MSATILIADDDQRVRDGIAEVLTEEGYDVLSVKDGEAALNMLKAKPVDLLISNLRMPGLTGKDLIREIRNQEATGEQFSIGALEIIVITAYRGDFNIKKAR